MVPWQRGEILMWDATCSDTFVASQKEIAVQESGAVAAVAEHCKRSKYSNLETTHNFVPIAVETLGVMGADAQSFFSGGCSSFEGCYQ